MTKKIKDLTGKRFGKLIAVSIDHRKGCRTYWKCVCDCGNSRIVSTDHLRNGDTTDCGCYRKHISHYEKHGMSQTRLYTIWSLMKRRCLNSSTKEYKSYGGRGITLCDEWLESKSFIDWALDNGYSDNLTLDRIDNDGNYCPENCRWVSRKVQSENRRSNRFITYNGETKTITQWAEDNGLKYYIVKKRLDILGWSVEKALTEPIQMKYSNKKIESEKQIV